MFRIKVQLPGMRKPDECVVYPKSDGDGSVLIFQGARTIGMVDAKTGRAIVNYRGTNPKYFIHLDKRLGAVRHNFPPEFCRQLEEIRHNSGDLIGTSPITGPVYVA